QVLQAELVAVPPDRRRDVPRAADGPHALLHRLLEGGPVAGGRGAAVRSAVAAAPAVGAEELPELVVAGARLLDGPGRAVGDGDVEHEQAPLPRAEPAAVVAGEKRTELVPVAPQ